jgi:hypothetical protein
MTGKVARQTVDLSGFPDLVVIYLGMRVNAWTGLKTLIGLGPQITAEADRKPDGLLLHENFLMSPSPVYVGMRQCWRDFDMFSARGRAGCSGQAAAAVVLGEQEIYDAGDQV